MSFATWAALAIAGLVIAPVLAHLLRRRPPDEKRFAATRLVPVSPALAARKSAIEDRALFSVRALSILLLALLGATPLVSCDRLALQRKDGASVALAILLDDSMSMRARLPGKSTTRFARAKAGALELVDGLGEGDVVALVLAGEPARVALAPAGQLAAVREAIETAEVSDRGTDLDGAMAIGAQLLADVPQVDRRMVLLSDRADAGKGPLEARDGVALWAPLEELGGVVDDCGVVHADRTADGVAVRVACGPVEGGADAGAPAAEGRRLAIRRGSETVASVPWPRAQGVRDVVVPLPAEAAGHEADSLEAWLLGGDAIAADDRAPVVAVGGELRVGLVSDVAEDSVETGGAPPLEQAFKALRLGVALRPLAAVPSRRDELDSLAALVVDDAPGFTPQQRRELAAWVERGGVLLLTLGPRAAAAPLGASFQPMLPGIVRWSETTAEGIAAKDDRLFGELGAGLAKLNPRGRTALELAEPDKLEVLTRWTDGAPFALQHRIGRGSCTILTLPFSTHQSDLALRGAFLELLRRQVERARSLGGAARAPIGGPFRFDGFRDVKVAYLGDATPREIPVARDKSVVASRAGAYRVTVDGQPIRRVVAIRPEEVDTTPRKVAAAARAEAFGGRGSRVDMSNQVALGLLALLFLELLLRMWAGRRGRGAAEAGAADATG